MIALSVARFGYADGAKQPVVAVAVNGQDLLATVFAAERRAGLLDKVERAADAHAPLPQGVVAPPAMHWLGQPDHDWCSDDGRAAVLTCKCGDLQCGGIVATIRLTDGEVVWSEFSNPRSRASLDIPSFRFARSRYEQAVRGVGP